MGLTFNSQFFYLILALVDYHVVKNSQCITLMTSVILYACPITRPLSSSCSFCPPAACKVNSIDVLHRCTLLNKYMSQISLHKATVFFIGLHFTD